MNEPSPTRSTFLELQGELERLGEGYRFLDEKSMLLAHEMLRQLARFQATQAELEQATARAESDLEQAVSRHGLDDLECLAPWNLSGLAPSVSTSAFLGLELLESRWPRAPTAPTGPRWPDSPEVGSVRRDYLQVLQLQFSQACTTGNLLRLRREYLRTERRARALDQLIMPGIRRSLKQIEEKLDENEQEENLSVRNARFRTTGLGGGRSPGQ